MQSNRCLFYFIFLVFLWTTDEEFSQGKLGGWRGSNACTIIAIVLAESFSSSSILSLPHGGKLCKDWYFVIADAIAEGNHIYDQYISKYGMLLDVKDVSDLITTKLGKSNVHVSEAKPVWLSSMSDPISCTLQFNLEELSCKRGKHCAVFICTSKSILIVSEGDATVFVIDTHFHPLISSGTNCFCRLARDIAAYLSKTCSFPYGTLTEVSFPTVIN